MEWKRWVWSGEGECEGVCSGVGISVERWRGLGRSRWCHQWEKIGGQESNIACEVCRS